MGFEVATPFVLTLLNRGYHPETYSESVAASAEPIRVQCDQALNRTCSPVRGVSGLKHEVGHDVLCGFNHVSEQ